MVSDILQHRRRSVFLNHEQKKKRYFEKELGMRNLTYAFLAFGFSLSIAGIGVGQAVTPTAGEKARQILERGLAESNPEKRKEAVIALSLQGMTGQVFSRLETALD